MKAIAILFGLLKLRLPEPLLRRLIGRKLKTVDRRKADPYAQVVGEIANALRGDGLPTVEQSRTQLDSMAAKFDLPFPDGIARHDVTMPGAVSGRPARIYVEEGRDPHAPGPTLLYLHGGGWMQGSIASHDGLCGRLAQKAGIRVISYDYRLAPEARYPAANDDVLTLYTALASDDGPWNIELARLAIGGDSAGANLTAGLMHDLAERGLPMPRAQLLIYPALDGRLQSGSMQSLRDGWLLTRQRIDWYLDLYLPEGHDRTDPRFSPGLSPHLTGQPETLIIAAGHDPLRDEALDHARALQAAGVGADIVEYPGQLHGFLSLSRVIPQGEEATSTAAQWLRDTLH